MGYTLTQINTVLSKADRAIHILGSVAYNKKFAELDETYWYDRDIIFLYKSAVEWGKVNDRVGTERMDWIVERLEAMMEIYDYGSLTPIYSQVAQVAGINTVNFLTEETDPTVPAWVKAITQLDIDSWDDSYGNKITSAGVTGTTTKTLTLNQQDGGTVTASWTDINTDAVSSVFGRTGAVTAQSGDYTTTQVTEGLNLYYTDGRVRSAISESIVGIDYNSTTGVFSTTAGYAIPTTSSQANWDTAYANRIASLTTNGTSGAATLINNILNIPNYTGALTGYVPYTGATANVDLGEYGISSGYFQADLTPTNTLQVGRMQWNSTDGTMDLRLMGNNVTLQIGQEQVARVVNGTGGNLLESNYQAVKIIGAQGQRLQVGLARADNDDNSKDTLGLVTENINNNQEGFITVSGLVNEINTTGSLQGETWTDGDTLYLSGSTFGAITNVKPSAPTHTVIVGFVVYAHQNHGKIFVKVDNGYELEELHDVAATPFINKGVLYRDTTTNLWKSATIGTLLGYTPANSATTLTINGTTYDLSANRTWSVGTVTSVSALTIGTSGTDISSTVANGTTTPVISLNIPTASATNRGALSSADWNTFNNKQAAGNYITALTGEATATGPGSASVTLSTSAVTAKLLTGLNLTGGGSIAATDSILQAFGKAQNQISALVGGVMYQGVWNASTNTPTLTSSVGTKGYYYVVNVAGSTNLNGITDWKVGDWAIFNGSTWDKVDNTDAVSSVNGFTGAVNLTTANISEVTNLYYTDTRARGAISLTTTGTSGAATYDNTTGVLNIPQYQSALTNPVTGTGTTNTLPKFTGASTIGNSNVTDDGSLITLGSNTYVNGAMGFGTSTVGSYIIRIVSPLTGGTTTYGISNAPIIQSSVTSAASIYRTAPQTQAASFTLSNLNHFFAEQSVIGAGSVVTNQIGFYADNSLIGATNNYGFYGGIPSGTNRWNLYMAGTANNYMGGALGIGATSLTARNLVLDRVITGSTTGISVFNISTIASDVTSAATSFRSSPSTQAAAFTLAVLNHFQVTNATIGAGSSVTTQIGYSVTSLTSATNNYAFVGSIPSGTNRFNLFMDGTAENYLAGNTGIGGVASYISSGPILTSTLTNGGSGYVDGTYTDVATTLVSSQGAGALYTIVVSGGVVTSATLTWGGSLYKVNDTISVSNTLLGGTGSGLIITINSVDSSQLTIANANGGDISLFRVDASVATGDNLGAIKFLNNDVSTKAAGVQAKITAYAAGSSAGAYLSFFTSTGAGGALNEAVRIGNGGQVGIGGAYSLTGYNLRVSKNITGAVNSYGIASDGEIQSGVTTSANLFYTSATTAATTFTLTSLNHFAAVQGTFGAGSTVTNQYGFIAGSSLTGATNNYGFFGGIASGTNRWNLYMSGTADNYLAGNIGIGGSQLNVSSGPILTTTLTNGGSGYVDGTYTDVLSTAITGNGSYALFTVIVSGGVVTTATLTWSGSTYRVGDTVTISNTLLGGTGSGLVITVNTVDSSQLTITSTTGADITLLRNDTTLSPNDNVGTIKWISNDSTTKASGIVAEIAANGESTNGGAYLSFSTRAGVTNSPLVEAIRISGNGGVGIGATTLTGYSLRVSKSITGAASSYGIVSDGQIQSGVTSTAYNFLSYPSTAAASFTLTSLHHFNASQNAGLGAGSAVTNQFGFVADSSLTAATNNYGFYGAIASGTNRWNLYMVGTANNYMAGNLGIGSTSVDTTMLRISRAFTSTLTTSVFLDSQVSSTGTSVNYIATSANTAAATFTVSSIRHINLTQGTFGAGSTVTNQFGVIVNSNMIGATNNYGFFGDIPSGTGRWNLYMDGTATNYLNGVLTIGTTSPNASAKVQIDSTNSGFLPPRMTSAQRTAIASPAEGLIVYQTDGTVGLYVYSGGSWKSLTMTTI